MTPKTLVLLALPLLARNATAQVAAPAPTADQLITRAAAAFGQVDSLRNKTVEFNTVTFALGQEETPSSPARATFVSGRTTYDYAARRLTTQQEQRPVTGAINRIRRVTLPQVSMVETNGTLQPDPAAVAANLERTLSLEIDQVLRAALHHRAAATVVPPRTMRGEVADGIRLVIGPDTLRIWFDRLTNLPVATETIRDDDIYGDRRTVTWYTRWQQAGPVKIPRQVDVMANDRLLSHTVVTGVTTNQALDAAAFTIPDSIRARAPAPLNAPAAPPAVAVTLNEIAPGLWRAEGGSHHTLVVEQGTNLLLVEAPQSAARMNAVLDTLRSRLPNRRVIAAVMTHHHHDHSGGIRATMARGATIIAHVRNIPFVREVAAARKTVAPDRLTRGAAVPPTRTVRDSMVLGTGSGRVVLYTLPTAHAEGVLAAWHPASGSLFTSDVLSPAANQPPVRAGSLELVTFARSRGISPTRFVGGHGVVVEWSAVESAAR